MRVRYHGSLTYAHGLGTLIGYDEHPGYLGQYHILMDTGYRLSYARRESFDILEDDDSECEVEEIQVSCV